MIKFKFEDIEIPESNPFQNCQLGRQEYATILENIVHMARMVMLCHLMEHGALVKPHLQKCGSSN